MNIELPKDAEGKEIPLDTKVLYSLSGEEYEVDEFTYSPSENIWRVALAKQFVHFCTCDMHLAPVVVLSADGKPVSIGDTVYCDDDPEPLTVNSFTVSECGPVVVQSAAGANYTVPAGRLTHERPGWDKLLDDMERAIHTPDPDTYASITCGYFDSANMDCAECERKHDICRETCNDAAWVDIAARIDKLRREDQ